MAPSRITVSTTVDAPVARAWEAYTTPAEIMRWNFASADWHCPAAEVDLRPGGRFSSRMAAKDGSMGFDFEGVYTAVIPHERLEYAFGERGAVVEFLPVGDCTGIRVSFDPETEHPTEMQRAGWQAILDNFAKHLARG